MLLAEQPVHQRFVRPGPLVLGSNLLKSPTPTADRDRTVSRRSEPRSRTALMGEQPNPWDQLQPQDATIRHRACFHRSRWRRLYLHPARDVSGEGPASDSGHRFGLSTSRALSHHPVKGWISRYGVMTVTFPSDFPRYCPRFIHEPVGVHRYKPEL
jgi:hypothetical protein